MTGHHLYTKDFRRLCALQVDSTGLPAEDRKRAAAYVRLCDAAQVFRLPDGGKLLDDGGEYRAIDESLPLRLPYPVTAIEFEDGGFGVIVFCVQGDDAIDLYPAVQQTATRQWTAPTGIQVPTTGYLDRENGVAFMSARSLLGRDLDAQEMDWGFVMLSLVNALSCVNVSAERQTARKPSKLKPAKNLDSYHVLTISGRQTRATEGASELGETRSPREHLRRGHIRRLEDGRRIWVSATVVAAGRGGSISKTYSFAA